MLCLCRGVQVFGERAGMNVGTIEVDVVEVDIVDAESQRYVHGSGARRKTKASASEKREERGIVWFVDIGYGGTGVRKEVKPDCVELTVWLGGARLNCEPRERSFHKFLWWR